MVTDTRAVCSLWTVHCASIAWAERDPAAAQLVRSLSHTRTDSFTRLPRRRLRNRHQRRRQPPQRELPRRGLQRPDRNEKHHVNGALAAHLIQLLLCFARDGKKRSLRVALRATVKKESKRVKACTRLRALITQARRRFSCSYTFLRKPVLKFVVLRNQPTSDDSLSSSVDRVEQTCRNHEESGRAPFFRQSPERELSLAASCTR